MRTLSCVGWSAWLHSLHAQPAVHEQTCSLIPYLSSTANGILLVVSVFSNTNHFYLVIRIWWPSGDSSQCCFGVPWDTENHWPKSQVDPSGGSREAVKLPDKGHRDPDRWVTSSIENLEARSRQVQASMGNYCKYWDEVLRPGLKDEVIDEGKTVAGGGRVLSLENQATTW